MDLTAVLHRMVAERRTPSSLNPTLPPKPLDLNKFPQVCGHISNQLVCLAHELALIRSLYITPYNPKSVLKANQLPEIPLNKLASMDDGNLNDDREYFTLIGLIHSTSKQNALVYLPPQWATIIDTFIKDSLSNITSTLKTMRNTLNEQRTLLSNLYKINDKNNKNNINMNNNDPSKPHIKIVALDRTPIEKFIYNLKQHHGELYKKKVKELLHRGEKINPSDQNYRNIIDNEPKPVPKMSKQEVIPVFPTSPSQVSRELRYDASLPKELKNLILQWQQDYWDIENLSFQALDHKEMVILTIEAMVVRLGQYTLSVEKERKQRQINYQTPFTLTSIQTADGTERAISSIVYSIAGPVGNHNNNSSRGQRKMKQGSNQNDKNDFNMYSTNPFAIHTADRDSALNDDVMRRVRAKMNDEDDEKTNGKKSNKNNKNNKKRTYDPANNNNNDPTPSQHQLSLLTDLYGLSTTQLTNERNAIQSSLDHDELALANQVEENLSQISSLISTFQGHILTQSETIDTIYKDVEVVNYNITSGNDELTEALERGAWGAKFYTYIFIIAAIALFIFDRLLN